PRSSSATPFSPSPTPTPSASFARRSACRAIPRRRRPRRRRATRRRRLLLHSSDEVLVGRAAPPRLQILTVLQGDASARALRLVELLHERVALGLVVDTEGEDLDVLPGHTARQSQLALG